VLTLVRLVSAIINIGRGESTSGKIVVKLVDLKEGRRIQPTTLNSKAVPAPIDEKQFLIGGEPCQLF
jgi:hypothetical protein